MPAEQVVDEHCGYTPANCPWGDACADCVPPVACVCGHLKRVHYGRHNEGTCLGAHRNKDGKEADATVCACAAFEEKS